MPRKPTDITQPKVRMREDLRRRLEKAAAKSGRTLNAEIIARLESTFVSESQSRLEARLLKLEDTVQSVMGTIYVKPEDSEK